MSTKTITPEVTAILNNSRIEGNILFLPTGQLDKKLYAAVNDVLARLGGKWNTKAKGHIFKGDPSEALVEVLTTGKAPAKNPDAYFPTPPDVIDSMMNKAHGTDYDTATARWLEPSAGEGAICDYLANDLNIPKANIEVCEYNLSRREVLESKGYSLFREPDFLKIPWADVYDRILMNPPFAVEGDKLAYIAHIEHAWKFLKEGGILVAIAPAGLDWRTDKRISEFREFCNTRGEVEELPRDAFKASGTMTATVMITLYNGDTQ